jgi:hypothetical protein
MRTRVHRLICRALCASAVMFARVPVGRADESLAGVWQAGASAMDVVVQSWGKDCGPQPRSTRSAGGGSVQLEQSGQVVTIRGAERDLRSDQCWSPNAALRRISTHYIAGVWTTRCKTAGEDPRQESGTYSLRLLEGGRLLYQDISHFDWKLNESTCVATITTTQTLSRVRAGKPTPGGVAAPQAPAAAAPCQPGAAKRLVVRPRSADVELGQTHCFHARVLDAAGCPLKDAALEWSLEHAPAIKAEIERGCFRAGHSSAEAEGSFTVVARHAGLKAEAKVQVSAVSLPALLAKRLETGAVVGEAMAESEAAPAQSSTRVAAKAIAESQAGGPRWLIVLAALLAAGAAVLFFLRSRPRARRARARASSSSSPSLARDTPAARGGIAPALRSGAMSDARTRRCPKCGASYPESSAFCGTDGTALTSAE